MLIPIILTFMWYLVHISVAINKSIVGQKHTRSQLFLKMYNHRSGPIAQDISLTPRSQFYIGVTSQVVQGTSVVPIAPIEMLGLGPDPKHMSIADDTPGEAKPNAYRQGIRVRTAFGICTHRRFVEQGGVAIIGLLTDFCGTVASGGQ